MSGGHWDYIQYKIEEIADELTEPGRTLSQRSFGEHLKKVAKAVHAIDWVYSGDWNNGDDEEAIKAVFTDLHEAKQLAILANDIAENLKKLEKLITP